MPRRSSPSVLSWSPPIPRAREGGGSFRTGRRKTPRHPHRSLAGTARSSTPPSHARAIRGLARAADPLTPGRRCRGVCRSFPIRDPCSRPRIAFKECTLESANMPACNASCLTRVSVASRGPATTGRISLLKRGELVREASHCVAVQESSPAHPGHAQRGQLGERRCLRQACDVHRAADLRDEAAQRVRLP